jgi:hypothetical protein
VKTRYREHKQLFGRSLLVLQVAYTQDDRYNDDAPPSARKVNEYWADATVEDLCLVEFKGGDV